VLVELSAGPFFFKPIATSSAIAASFYVKVSKLYYRTRTDVIFMTGGCQE